VTDYSPVAPWKIHQKLEDLGLMGNTHLLIATEVLKHEREYRALYDMTRARRKATGTPVPTIIMDNGVIETGVSLAATDLLKACDIVGADILVLPDVMHDATETIKASYDALADIGAARSVKGPKLLGVAQGKTYDDYRSCAWWLVKKCGVEVISVPRNVVKMLGTRWILAQEIWLEHGLPIHLLGFSDDVKDDLKVARLPYVTSIDSATPIWLGMSYPDADTFTNLCGLNTAAEIGGFKRPQNYWELDDEDLTVESIANIAHIREFLR
jgi:hypothetical protein